MKEQTSTRKSNFELLRIVAILLVITSHFCVHSNKAIYFQNPYTFNINYFLTLIFTTGNIANNIFILITGYFMVKKEKNNKKIISLILDMEFYSISIYLILNALGLIKNISPLKSIFAIFYGNWFCIYYIILYLISPYLNHILNTLPKEKIKKLIITLLILISVVPTFIDVWGFTSHDVFILSYLIGGYIRLYLDKKQDTKRIKIVLLYTIVLVILCVLSLYLIGITFKIFPFIEYYPHKLLVNNTSIFVIIIATCIFLLVKNKNIQYNRSINVASTTVLGIYLIHDNELLRYIIWNKFVPIDLYFTKWYFPIYAIIKILIVFIICYIIVKIKQMILNKPFNYIVDKIEEMIGDSNERTRRKQIWLFKRKNYRRVDKIKK